MTKLVNKKRVAITTVLLGLTLLAGHAAKADITVSIQDGYYGPSSLTLTSAEETGSAQLVGAAADYGSTFNLFLTNADNIIVDDIFAPGGGDYPGPSDDIFVAGGAMTDAYLGTSCVAGSQDECIPFTFDGSTQDLFPDLASISSNCGGGAPCDLEVSSTDGIAAPEPASLAILGAGLAGLGFLRRRKKA